MAEARPAERLGHGGVGSRLRSSAARLLTARLPAVAPLAALRTAALSDAGSVTALLPCRAATLPCRAATLLPTTAAATRRGAGFVVEPQCQRDPLALGVRLQDLHAHDLPGLHDFPGVGHEAVGHRRHVDQPVLVHSDV